MEQCNACKCNKGCYQECNKTCMNKSECCYEKKMTCPEKMVCPEKRMCSEKMVCPEKKMYQEKMVCPEKMACPDNMNDVIGCMPLAMAYVPWQQWGDVYTAECGHANGTIFPELVKPWWVCCGQKCGTSCDMRR